MKALAILLSAALLAAGPALGEEKKASNTATHNAALDAKVRGALAADVGLKTLKINVDVDNSVVTLKGRVDSEETKRKAGEVARKVNGVKAVHNELQVERKS